MTRPVQAVFFDLDDTLFDHSYAMRQGLEAMRTTHPALSARDQIAVEQEYARLLDEVHPLVLAGSITLAVSRIERARRLLVWSGHQCAPGEADELAAHFRVVYQEGRRPVPGARELLEHLHSRTTVGIVTNNLTAEQESKLRHCGLERWIHFLLTSEEAGAIKPDPVIYQAALVRAGCLAEEAVMVGDSWAADVCGALDAGLRAVWVNPENRQAPEPLPVPSLRSFLPLEGAMTVILE